MLLIHNRKALVGIVIFILSIFMVLPWSQASAMGQPDSIPSTFRTTANGEVSAGAEKMAVSSGGSEMKSNGISLAGVVMVGMIICLLYVGVTYGRGFTALPKIFSGRWQKYAVPVLCVIGLGVAGYLSYVEIFVVEAVCGPVGDCNAVQSSIYAKLFGFLPIGVLGMGGYVAIFSAWLYPRIRTDRLAHYAPLANFCMAIFGVIFSIYLTYLEIFVIRAVCMWCVSSAVIMTLLLLVTLGPALKVMDDESSEED